MTNKIELESEPRKLDKVSWTAWQTISTVFNVLNHTLIIIVAVYMTCLTYTIIHRDGNELKLWHPILCTIGYQLLMAESILAFYSHNVWSRNFTRQTHRTLLWVLQAVGSTIAMIGILCEYISREQRGKGHFKADHAALGLTAAILTIISMFGGISALWTVYLKRFMRPVYIKLAHNLNGIAAFVIGMAALFMGYDIKIMQQESRPDIRIWLQAFCVITTVLTLFGAVRASIRHVQASCS